MKMMIKLNDDFVARVWIAASTDEGLKFHKAKLQNGVNDINLLEMTGKEEDHYVVGFKYQDKKGTRVLMKTKPQIKDVWKLPFDLGEIKLSGYQLLTWTEYKDLQNENPF